MKTVKIFLIAVIKTAEAIAKRTAFALISVICLFFAISPIYLALDITVKSDIV